MGDRPPHVDLIREMPGKGRCDLSALLRDPEGFSFVIEALARPYAAESIDLVVGLEAAGLVFAGAVADRLRSGVALLRRPGKSAWTVRQATCRDYSGEEKTFELVTDVIEPGQRCLVVDDWSETGAQLAVARRMVESECGVVVGFACVNVDGAARRHPDLSGCPLVSAFNRGAAVDPDPRP